MSIFLRFEVTWVCSGTFGHCQPQLILLGRQEVNKRSQKSLSYSHSYAEIGLKILLWEQDVSCTSLVFGSPQPVLAPSPGGNLACSPSHQGPTPSFAFLSFAERQPAERVVAVFLGL